MKFLRYLIISTWLILPLQATANLNEDSAKEFVADIGIGLSRLLQSDTLFSQAYFMEVRKLLKEKLDLPVISQFLLGTYGRGLDKSVQDEFAVALEDYIVHVYGVRLREYYGGELLVVENASEQSGTYLVDSHIEGNENISVTWRLYQNDAGDIKVIDLLLSDVSMVVSQRDEFSAIIRNNNDDVRILIEKMQEQIEKASQ